MSGFLLFTILLIAAFSSLPPVIWDHSSTHYFFAIGLLAGWRYGWGLTHFIRSLIYRHLVFPWWRAQVDRNTSAYAPSKIYMVLTTYRVEPEISMRVVSAAIRESVNCNIPTVIIGSVVELADEFLYKQLFQDLNPPEHVQLRIVRRPGTGKRDALAQAFKTISRDMPPPDAIVTVIDGDTVLHPEVLTRCLGFFKFNPRIGALTTDEYADAGGNKLYQDWHDLRFGQRQILMSSLGLSKRVITLTGRMSMFRADIVIDPRFIHHMINDHLDHWRLGRFQFLTGDDKSSLYWVLEQGYEQLYIPDVSVTAIETPPSTNFFIGSSRLMFRWFGNMLRTNARILKLGPGRMPFFVWWSFLDQRLSMWTSLSGPIFALILSIQYTPAVILYYFVWVLFVRWIMSLLLLSVRPQITWRYPLLMYYNQIYGALMKTYVLFRLDRQSWTRQKTRLNRNLSFWEKHWNTASSLILHTGAYIVFFALIGTLTGAFGIPSAAIRFLFG